MSFFQIGTVFYISHDYSSKQGTVVHRRVDWLQSLKQFFISVSYYILVASLTLMSLLTEPSELDWLQVYDRAIRVRLATSI